MAGGDVGVLVQQQQAGIMKVLLVSMAEMVLFIMAKLRIVTGKTAAQPKRLGHFWLYSLFVFRFAPFQVRNAAS